MLLQHFLLYGKILVHKGGVIMAKCEICGKTPQKGIQLSHSHIKSKRVWAPNVRRVKVDMDGHIKRLNVCTRCLRSEKFREPIKKLACKVKHAFLISKILLIFMSKQTQYRLYGFFLCLLAALRRKSSCQSPLSVHVV